MTKNVYVLATLTTARFSVLDFLVHVALLAKFLRGHSMNLFKAIGQMIRFLSEGASEIFSPDRNEYPKTGVQPYEDDPLSERVD